MIMLAAGSLLFIAFLLHILWWRIRMPVTSTGVLLLVFFVTPIIIVSFCNMQMTMADFLRLILLYSSCALVYIILYSAIEQQSPTLAIVNTINSRGERGCEEDALLVGSQLKSMADRRLMAAGLRLQLVQHLAVVLSGDAARMGKLE